MASDKSSENSPGLFPAILRGREGRMNGYIIRYLALNGPSLIYSVAKDLASKSQTRIHYPTVNRRMHDLEHQKYLEKAGARTTKAGIPADLYANTIRGYFAGLGGIPETSVEPVLELSLREIHQMIRNASSKGSPFVLLQNILEEGSKEAEELVDKLLVPEIIKGVRNGHLNLEALEEGVIYSTFASIVSRKIINITSDSGQKDSHRSREKEKDSRRYISILINCVEKIVVSNPAGITRKVSGNTFKSKADQSNLAASHQVSIPYQWANELKVLLKLHSLGFE